MKQEHRENLSKACRGKTKSIEHRAKLSRSLKTVWERRKGEKMEVKIDADGNISIQITKKQLKEGIDINELLANKKLNESVPEQLKTTEVK